MRTAYWQATGLVVGGRLADEAQVQALPVFSPVHPPALHCASVHNALEATASSLHCPLTHTSKAQPAEPQEVLVVQAPSCKPVPVQERPLHIPAMKGP